ncbi:MAG: phosphate acyltransferase PlsX [Bacillota bacterium]|nr:phosphate acyltransferase PlsX [Bacillota bacterium]
MIIAVDGMGGDNAPGEVVSGCVMAINEYKDIEIIITGPEEKITEEINKYNFDKKRIRVLDAKEVITTNESPVLALKRKKESSLYKALQLVKNGEAAAVVSAGSTGALMAGASLIIGRIKGIDRVALAPLMPGKNAAFMIVDAGANVDCKPQYLVQFALMGKVYFESVLNINKPSVGLANIGSEEEKGNELTKSAYKLLKETDINFVGNVEPRDVSSGDVNIVVCDGFVGNTILKTYEGVASNILKMLKEEIMSSLKSKIGGLLLSGVFKKFKKKFDYTEYGGSAFLGTKGICIKAHGSSDSNAFKHAIKQAKICYDNNVIEKIQNELEKSVTIQ